MFNQQPLRIPLWSILLSVAVGAGCSQSPSAGPGHQTHGDRGHHRHNPDGVHKRFDDAEKWAQRFESPDRDARQKPDHVVAVLDLPKNALVADIGSATGYFPVRFARAVPQGWVYGLDIEGDMVRYLNERARREGLTNLTSMQADADDPHIPKPVDLIFLCNTYHHIGQRVNYFRSRLADLRPGGRLVVVDYKPGDLPYGPPADHKVPPDQVVEELNEAGYRLIAQDDGLEWQFFYIFAPAQ
ncbi:MAG: class I SAM-dependent methyltransferase [bacterium]|nr:class I SAM-dependent methyltransferase [bacterium]